MTHQTNIAQTNEHIDLLTIRIRKLMESKKINESELARQTQIPQPTIHKILSGKTSDPRASTLKALADFFKVSIDELINAHPNVNKPWTSSKNNMIPLVSWKECIDWKGSKRNSSFSSNKRLVTEHIISDGYALTSKTSMESYFPKGSILIVDPNLSPEDGDLVVAFYPQTEEATLRKLIIDGPNKLLITMKGDDSSPWNKSVKILGVVIQSQYTHRKVANELDKQ